MEQEIPETKATVGCVDDMRLFFVRPAAAREGSGRNCGNEIA